MQENLFQAPEHQPRPMEERVEEVLSAMLNAESVSAARRELSEAPPDVRDAMRYLSPDLFRRSTEQEERELADAESEAADAEEAVYEAEEHRDRCEEHADRAQRRLEKAEATRDFLVDVAEMIGVADV